MGCRAAKQELVRDDRHAAEGGGWWAVGGTGDDILRGVVWTGMIKRIYNAKLLIHATYAPIEITS